MEGVSFDTTLAKKSPEVKELTAEMPAAEAEFPIHRDGEVTFASAETEVSDVTEQVPDPEPVRKKKNKMDADAIAAEAGVVAAAATAQMQKPVKAYRYPPLSLLKRGPRSGGESDASLRETAMKLQQTLQNFGVHVTVTNVSCGPSVTRYELQPEMGVKVSKIVGLADDIKLNLAAADIRIEAPIPGKQPWV